MASFVASESDPPYAAMIVAKLGGMAFTTGKKTSVIVGDASFDGNSALRIIARLTGLYGGNDPMASTEMDHWVGVATRIAGTKEPTALEVELSAFNGALSLRTFLVGEVPSMADAAMYVAIKTNPALGAVNPASIGHVQRYLNTCDGVDAFASVGSGIAAPTSKEKEKSAGKFFVLKDAKDGEVVTRFPPEASGYLHIGHAKAATINQYLARQHKGKLIMRFDDTNPEKESLEFEAVILQDLKLLGVKPDQYTHTSDHFDTLLSHAQKLVDEGKAFVDDATAEELSALRMKKQPSAKRDASVSDNQKLWKEMVAGSATGVKCCLRIKIDPKSDNGAMRDPVIYRCKPEPHVKTGNKYKVYPTYDFACPLVDSIEGVTHALRTTEYHDRNPQYEFIGKACGLRVPHIEDFSRLAFVNTCMAKRQLRWFIQTGRVKDWSDPSFPTVRGILRHGMTLEALQSFLISQGASKAVGLMEWDKIWAENRSVIDPLAPRHTAILAKGKVPLTITGQETKEVKIPLHPKNKDVGHKNVWFSSTCYLELADTVNLSEGEKVTLMDFGNVTITKITKTFGVVRAVEVTPNPGDTNYAGTKKLTWLPACDQETAVPIECHEVAPLITTKNVPKEEGEEGLQKAASKVPRRKYTLIGSSSLADLRQGDIIQLNRKGFWICDEAPNLLLGRPAVLVDIPDGHTKERSTLREADEVLIGSEATLTDARNAEANYHKQHKETKKAKGDKDLLEELKTNENEAKAIADLIQGSLDKNEGEITAEKLAENVRALKASGATPAEVKSAVAKLDAKAPPASAGAAAGGDAEAILSRCSEQGLVVRAAKEALKAGSGSKDAVDAAVKELLAIKEEYKALTGQSVPKNLPPPKAGAAAAAPAGAGNGEAILARYAAQGEVVRAAKEAQKKGGGSKEATDAAVKELLAIKAEYKAATGQDMPKAAPAAKGSKKGKAGEAKAPVQQPAAAAAAALPPSPEAAAILERHTAQGLKVRAAKAAEKDGTGSKEAAAAEVKKLLEIKAEYKALTGSDVPKPGQPARGEGSKNKGVDKKQAQAKAAKSSNEKGKTKLGIEISKAVDLSGWYTDCIVKAEMIEYYDVSGCYILRPQAYVIWDFIKDFFDAEIKKTGVENAYFPMFVPEKALQKEKDHIEDFAPEVAWVTRSGNSEMAEPVAIRPTSETVMYPSFAKWIQSHRDLPLKLNQWCNVVRWEFKQPQPFLRTREFLWQEGHTAFASKEDAEAEVMVMLELYRRVYEELLACPVMPGRKTEKEKFAGGDFTTTVEAFIPAAGRAIQGATSHHLGQNFSKMFDIYYQGPNDKKKDSLVYQNSWGITTRTIGVMVMVHGDDKGIVVPPRVSRVQVVLMATGISGKAADVVDGLNANVRRFETELAEAGVRCHVDARDNYTNAWKYNYWELRGVPIRLEYGPRDMEGKKVMLVRRDTGEKISVPEDGLAQTIVNLLEKIQAEMFARAKKQYDDARILIDDWKDAVPNLNKKNVLLMPFCGAKDCEGEIKDLTANAAVDEHGDVDPNAPSMGAKSLCIPFEQPRELKPGECCIRPGCGKPATCITLFGRSY